MDEKGGKESQMRRFGSVVAQLTPLRYIEKSEQALAYANFKIGVGDWLLLTGAASIAISALTVFGLLRLVEFQATVWLFIVLIAILSGVCMAAFHNIALFYGQKRAVQIEAILPDALQLVAANMRADIPIHKSLILAARPEFGLLAEQLNIIGEEIMGGVSVEVAFENFSKRVKSPLVKRVSTLMDESLRSGHDIAGLLEQLSHDMRSFKILEEEAKANIASYIVFIVMAVVVIAPILYSISISFVDLSAAVKSGLDIGEMSGAITGAGGSLAGWITTEQSITPDMLIVFAAANLFISAVFAAFVVSVLQTGEALRKLPFIPIFVAGSVGLFIVAITLLRTILLGIFF